ncbi:hypothetical protein ON010_g4662 [Phytophthora cinnamomi]|nr:hypothetical protein ON010_g4662 [Phytophthora cinnamomi]
MEADVEALEVTDVDENLGVHAKRQSVPLTHERVGAERADDGVGHAVQAHNSILQFHIAEDVRHDLVDDGILLSVGLHAGLHEGGDRDHVAVTDVALGVLEHVQVSAHHVEVAQAQVGESLLREALGMMLAAAMFGILTVRFDVGSHVHMLVDPAVVYETARVSSRALKGCAVGSERGQHVNANRVAKSARDAGVWLSWGEPPAGGVPWGEPVVRKTTVPAIGLPGGGTALGAATETHAATEEAETGGLPFYPEEVHGSDGLAKVAPPQRRVSGQVGERAPQKQVDKQHGQRDPFWCTVIAVHISSDEAL